MLGLTHPLMEPTHSDAVVVSTWRWNVVGLYTQFVTGVAGALNFPA